MFRVIVLGGTALVAGVTGCASAVGVTDSGMPHEGPVAVDAQDALPQDTAVASDVVEDFPREGPVQLDAAVDAAGDAADVPCFPRETAVPLDSGCR